MNARTLYPIPAAAPSSFCERCDTRIYLVTAAAGDMKVVDCQDDGTRVPTFTKPGEGYEHPQTCADAPARRRSHLTGQAR